MISCCLKIINNIIEQQKYYITESTFNFCINDCIYINSKYRCINANDDEIYDFMRKYIKNSIDKFSEMKFGETQIPLKCLIKYHISEDTVIIPININDLYLSVNNHIENIKKTKDYKILVFLTHKHEYEIEYINCIENINDKNSNICKKNTLECVTKKSSCSIFSIRAIFEYIIKKQYLINVKNDNKLILCLKKFNNDKCFSMRGNYLSISDSILNVPTRIYVGGTRYEHYDKIYREFIDHFKTNEKWQEIKDNIILL